MTTESRGRRWAAAVLLMGFVACERSDFTVPPPPARDISPHLTAEAAAAFSAKGEFALARPTSVSGQPMLTAEQARTFAVAYVRTYGRFFAADWSKAHGRTVSPDALVLGHRAFFAQSPYEPITDDVHPSTRHTTAPHYLMTFDLHGRPAVSLAVSAYATGLRVNARGKLERAPGGGGMEVDHFGIPLDGGRFRFLTPEAAAEEVALATGRKVRSVPELVLTQASDSPVLAQWKVTLDDRVHLVTTKGSENHHSDVLYLSPLRARNLQIADPGGPRTQIRGTLRPGGNLRNAADHQKVTVRVRPGHVISYKPVKLGRTD